MTAAIESGPGRSIVWLASYPKSGSTWVRAFLTAFLDPGSPVDLGALVGKPRLLDRHMLDDMAGIDSAQLSPAALIPYQAMQIRALAASAQAPIFFKTHSQYLVGPGGHALFPAEATAGAICIVRNPVDVVPSYAHHEGKTFDEIIGMLADDSAMLDHWPTRRSPNIAQTVGSWGAHALSWINAAPFPVHLVRYEDLVREPHARFTQMLDFLRLSPAPERVRYAAARASFAALAQAETEHGFAEKPTTARPFFREGQIGTGQNELTGDQLAKVLLTCAPVMQRLGYSIDQNDYQRSTSL